MTKQQENRAFVKMLKEFPKAFGRVSFRERLMLRAAFTYVIEEVIADIKANCDLAIEGRDIKIKELEKENRRLNKLYTLAKDVVKQFLNDCVITNDVLDKIEPLIKEMKIEY